MNRQAALLEEDEASRRRALLLDSFIVEAPAGAGKTELLTQRYLRLLAVVDHPEEIVAITFTNKAAAEMKNRILESLELAAAGVPPEAAHKRITFALAHAALRTGAERGWELVDQPARLRILTIDSLCASLARQMPILSRFGAQPKISDDPARHYDEAARRTLGLLDDEGEAGEAVMVITEALRYLDNDAGRCARLLASMLARRDQWLGHTVNHGPCEEAEAGLTALVQRDLARAASRLDSRLQERLMPAARYAAGRLAEDSPIAALADWSEPLPTTPEALPQWRALCELLLTGKNTLRKKLTVNEGFPPGPESEPFKKALLDCLGGLSTEDSDAIARIRKLPDPRYTEEEWRIVEALAKLLKLAAVQLWAVFLEEGEADFVEVAQRALLALGDEDEPSDLALKLDYRIGHLLVDEFQDTSPTQVQLLQRLTAGWLPDDGRTLFAVGDPMQSIYHFRKADVGLFLRSAETGIGCISLQPLRLYRNNRSCDAVVDWVNGSFDRVFPIEDSVTSGAIKYRPFVATRAALPGAGVHVHPVIVPRELAADVADILEARVILEIISAERAADPTRTIAVLVRARSHLDALVAEIRRHRPELRFQAVEIEGLSARQPVQDLLSLTRALHHRADRVNWLAILRAPWCGLTLADLHALAADDQTSTLWQLIGDEERCARLSEDGRERLSHLKSVINEAYAHQGRSRLSRWVEGVWLKLGGAACLAGPAEVADAKAYLDLLDELDAAGRFSLDRLEQEVAVLYAAPDAQADGSLQFMTIHKSKGLEFDTVILPGLQKKGRNDEHELMLWEEVVLEGPNEKLGEHLVAAPLRKRGRGGNGGGVPSPYDYLRLLEQERSGNEDARVLYVAATRAIRSLHLVGVAKTNGEGEPIRPAGSFLDLLWTSVAGEFRSAVVSSHAASASDENFYAPKLVRVVVPSIPGILNRPPASKPQGYETAAAGTIAEAEQGAEYPLDASVGTLVHAYLEMIARPGAGAWTIERIHSLQAAMTLWLVQHGHAASEAKEGAARVEICLNATVGSEDGRWVLAPREGAAAELAVTALERDSGRDKIATQVVDRSFVEDGVRWIIDYKTARVEGDEGDEKALLDHAERYRAQLEGYAELFADEGLSLRLGIFYAALGRLIELPVCAGLPPGVSSNHNPSAAC